MNTSGGLSTLNTINSASLSSGATFSASGSNSSFPTALASPLTTSTLGNRPIYYAPEPSFPPALPAGLSPPSRGTTGREYPLRTDPPARGPAFGQLEENCTLSVGPSIRPLDYGRLQTTEGVQAELDKTIQELAQWLGIVERGLGQILDSPEGDPRV